MTGTNRGLGQDRSLDSRAVENRTGERGLVQVEVVQRPLVQEEQEGVVQRSLAHAEGVRRLLVQVEWRTARRRVEL